MSGAAQSATVLERFLPQISPDIMVPGADRYGTMRDDLPIVPIFSDDELAGYLYATSDFVGTTGYSGKPIHVLVAVDPDGKLLGAQLVKHSEPIVLTGIPDHKIKALTASYRGLDLVKEAAAGGSGHDLNIISGATVTIMVIDDSIVRSALKVARALGLGGLSSDPTALKPTMEIDQAAEIPETWDKIDRNGGFRRLVVDVGQINAAFQAGGDPRAIDRPEPGDASDLFLDLGTALVSVPAIGRGLLGETEYRNLTAWLNPGEHAILVAGRGRYSFKGSGYVRGGIFDRFQLIQGDRSVRFRDRMHRRLGAIAIAGAPQFTELDLFKIPADAGFEPTQAWRLQLLVNRAVGPVQKVFQTLDLDYRLPEAFIRPIEIAMPLPVVADQSEAAAKRALWMRIWWDNRVSIAGLLIMLTTLTGAFFFQMFLIKSETLTYWFRIVFLTLTLVFIGWYANAQLSIVNLFALTNSLITGFSWDAFLLDPLIFILWFSVAVALLFWGRGAYCGWLCPFGALQELTNRIAKTFKVPQLTLPWGLHERLWPLKYILFLGLFGLSLASLPLAEQFAEIEPFKTAIILKFQRSWPFVLFAAVLLIIGLFIERFYCRYLCPLGAALAIPGRIRMFDWLKRYHECGNPCRTCHNECMVQAIHPTGQINPNECLYCLHCQVRYQDDQTCPVCVKRRKRRERRERNPAYLPTFVIQKGESDPASP